MKKIIFLMFVALVYSQDGYNPCEDVMYNKIVEKDLDQMSDREYEYYQKLDKECKDYQKAQKYIEKNMDNMSSVTTNEPEPDEKMYALYEGPRFGVTYVSGDLPDVLSSPVLFQFGWQFERRIFGNAGESIGLIEFVTLIGGMEQGMLIPSLTSAFGMRSAEGREFAFGPNLSFSENDDGDPSINIGYAMALGFSMQTGGIVFPHNISLVLSEGNIRASYILGFNSYRN